MGLSGGSKTTTTTSVAPEAKPYLTGASSALQGAYDRNQGNTQAITDSLMGAFNAYSSNLGQNLSGVRDFATGIMSADPASNPYLDDIVNTTNASVADRINALFSKAGQTGSSRQIGELGARLAENESNLRYSDYNTQRDRQMLGAQLLMGLNDADNANAATLAQLGSSAASIPWIDANNLAAGLGSLWGGQTQTTQKTSGGGLGGLLGTALGAWAGGGFKGI